MSQQVNGVRWGILALLMAFAFTAHFNRVSISVAGTERLIQQYRFSETEMGSIYSAYLLVYTALMIPGGWCIDRFGARATLGGLGVGSAIFVAITGAVGLVSDGALALAAFWIVRSMLGLVSVPLHPACARSVAQCIPPAGRSMANGLVTAAAVLGVASTYYLFGAMIDAFDWPWAFVLSALATVLLAGAWLASTGGSSVSTGDGLGSPARHDGLSLVGGTFAAAPGRLPAFHTLLRNRSLMLLTASYAALGYFQYLFFYWMQYYFQVVLEYDAQQSRLYATIPNLAMAAGMFAGGGLSDRLVESMGPRRGRAIVPGVGLAASATLLMLGIVASEPLWIVTFFALAMGAAGLGEGCFWTTAIEIGGRRGGTSAAIFNTGGNLGGLLAPVVTPLFSAYFGWQWGLALASLVCLVGAVFWIWIDPAERVDV